MNATRKECLILVNGLLFLEFAFLWEREVGKLVSDHRKKKRGENQTNRHRAKFQNAFEGDIKGLDARKFFQGEICIPPQRRTKNQVESWFLLDACSSRRELLSGEKCDAADREEFPPCLRIFGLDVVDGVRGLHPRGWWSFWSKVLRKICIPPRRRRTKWRLDSFWML